jgi:hypothetical protein
MNQLELILENIRLSHTERLLQEAQSDLELVRGQRLINESIMAIKDALLQENEDERPGIGNHLRNNWGKYAAGGAGIGMAHAGAFGNQAKNFVDNAGTMGQHMGDRLAAHASESMKKAGDFYNTPGAPGNPSHPVTPIGARINPNVGEGEVAGVQAGQAKAMTAAEHFAAGHKLNRQAYIDSKADALGKAFDANKGKTHLADQTLHNHDIDTNGNFVEQIGNDTGNWLTQHGDDILLGAGGLGIAGLAGYAGLRAGRRRP